MGLFDSLMGRSKPPKPNLDQLFALPGASLSLEVATVFRPTGCGSVAFRAPEGRAFTDIQADVEALLGSTSTVPMRVSNDEYGYTWITLCTEPPDMATLVTDLHAVNSSLAESGFGSTLLCTVVTFDSEDNRTLGLVYLFKQGTFYPFAPERGESLRRDNITELQVRDLLQGEVRIEPNLTRWFGLWGAPGLE